MGFRITTNMMLNSYRYNLQGSTKKLSDARDMVLTQRNFNSYAEDPAAATQEFRLRRTLYQTYSQLSNTKITYSKFNTAWNNLTEIKNQLLDRNAIQSAIRGENGPTGEARRNLAITLRGTAESLIHALNQKLGDQFIFAGNDGLNVPFEWKGETLYYRGIDVRSGGLVDKPTADVPAGLQKLYNDATSTDPADEQALACYNYYTRQSDEKPSDEALEYYLNTYVKSDLSSNISETEQAAWVDYYMRKTNTEPAADEPDWANPRDKYGMPTSIPENPTDRDKEWIAYYADQSNYQKLKEMGGEELYIDLGMGLAESSPNNPVNGSYFNSALCGIAFTGFGVDEDGDPLNLALLMRELADVFQCWDEDTQSYNPELAGKSAQGLSSEELEEKAFRLLDKLQNARDSFTEKWVELDAESTFLTSNQERLENLFVDTNTEILDVSQVDLAEAITSFSWQQYCYNAALKIGNQLLSQSLIDYMN